MTRTLRGTLISLALVLTMASITSLGSFLITLYKEEKLVTISKNEFNSTKAVASRLDNLIKLASLMELNYVRESKEILFLYEDPCDTTHPLRGGISKYYEFQFKELELDTRQWAESLDVYRACQGSPGSGQRSEDVIIIPSDVQIMEPFVLALIKTASGRRLAMISMAGFQASTASTFFLTDPTGAILWAADGSAYLDSALEDSRVPRATIEEFARQDLTPRSVWIGDGLLSLAPVTRSWIMFSLAYRPAILGPVKFVTIQSIVLALGIFFAVFLFGKKFAEFVSRPLEQLRASAERIGRGEFNIRLKESYFAELGGVQDAFNLMSEKIQGLLVESERKASLESELKLAHQVQRLLLPPASFELRGHRLFSFVKAAEIVGGDWWGYVEVPVPGRSPLLLLLIGDATDHGASAALVVATVKGGESMLSSWVERHPELVSDPSVALTLLNKAVYAVSKSTITMSLVAILIDTEKRVLTCANAGHPLPYLLQPDGSITSLGRSGVVLGASPDTVYRDVATYPWPVGAKLFLYTDGLVDCYKGDANLFPRKTLQRFLKDATGVPGSQLLSRLMAHRNKLVGDRAETDDVAAVVCEAMEAPDGL